MKRRIDGKNCIVTGANAGIGYAAAHGLASRGATVHMVCRNKERGEAALSKIQTSTGNQNVHLEFCDLSSVNDVKFFSSRFRAKDVPVHVLVHVESVHDPKVGIVYEPTSLIQALADLLTRSTNIQS